MTQKKENILLIVITWILSIGLLILGLAISGNVVYNYIVNKEVIDGSLFVLGISLALNALIIAKGKTPKI